MLYALRKLIAFVFLGGIFWFIYRDPAEIGDPVFMRTLGALTLAFAFFWLVVPQIVVRLRIRARRRKNAARYVLWQESLAGAAPRPLAQKNIRLDLFPEEQVYMHEKGTLYVPVRAGFDEVSAPGSPGDVAFPGMRRNSRKIQRTHCYLTDRQIVFAGKTLNLRVPYGNLQKAVDMPGGMVFSVLEKGRVLRLAFTFQNPLIAADYVRMLRAGGRA